MTVFDPHRTWRVQAICLDIPEAEDLFFAGGSQADRNPSPKTRDAWDQAKAICAMCPVIKECRRDTLGEEFGVWGGRDQVERHAERRRLTKASRRWPEDERLEWGRIVTWMRGIDMTPTAIYRTTGLGATLQVALAEEWKRHLARPKEAPAVVDLPLPDMEVRPFPEKDGERHLWVRHNRMVTDGWYRGQTPDGAWVRVETWAGRGRTVKKWVRKDDVRIYRPQPVIIVNYKGRPDVSAA